MEIDANAFASELLIPGYLLADALEGGGVDLEDESAIEVLARRFRVSTAAMRFRLARL
jgi:Zn-dependent peptidase ImmA (M78 family)